MVYKTEIEGFTIRTATPNDAELILGFIRELAIYEDMLDDVVATPELLREQLFEQKGAEVIIGEQCGEAVCFALYFYSFSTFLGRRGIYLEDLFVMQSHRGKGYGKAMLSRLSAFVVEQGGGRLEWACLDWNTPSIEFYKSLGAITQDEWTTYRLTGEALKNLADAGHKPR